MLISLRSLEKSYPAGASRNYVLRRITLDAAAVLLIMGPSGAGKSSLLHVLGLHDADWAGADFLDADYKLKPKDRAELHWHIGFVFQSYHLLDNLTVQNLEVPLSIATSAARNARP